MKASTRTLAPALVPTISDLLTTSKYTQDMRRRICEAVDDVVSRDLLKLRVAHLEHLPEPQVAQLRLAIQEFKKPVDPSPTDRQIRGRFRVMHVIRKVAIDAGVGS